MNKNVQISGGFWLLISWFTAVNGLQVLAEVLSAVIIHELGHWVALRLLGAEVRGIKISVLGAVLETDCRRLSYGRELAAVLAGPGMNILAASALSKFGIGSASAIGAHLVLGAFNLLPVWPLDGGRALYLLGGWLIGSDWGGRGCILIGKVTAGALAAGLIWLMVRTGGSLWLLPAAIGILAAGFLPQL